jgi:hypothetical protein
MSASPSPVSLEAPPSFERRAWTRIDTCLEVSCQYETEANDQVFGSGEVVNVSRGGLRILSGQRIEPGTVLRVAIADGENGLFTLLQARVIHTAPSSDGRWFMGCSFTPKLREEILAWMQNIGREPATK